MIALSRFHVAVCMALAAFAAQTGCRPGSATTTPTSVSEANVPHGADGQAAVKSPTAKNASAAGSAHPLTFSRHIAPIVFQNCVICHRPGESGPFSLLTYNDVKKRAGQISDVTETRFMPPWLPEPGYGGPFLGERRLSTRQIATIRQWAEQGAPQGDPADLPEPPSFPTGWQLGTPDLVVQLATPFTLPADETDVYRNFVIPVDVSTTRYVRAFEYRPKNPQVVHHVVLYVDNTGESGRLDAEDPEPGFPGMDQTTSWLPDGLFHGWNPGEVPFPGRKGMAWRLEPGMDLVLQLHMQPSGKPEKIQPTFGLFFSEEPPTVFTHSYVLDTSDIDIPAGANDYVVEDRIVLPVDMEVTGVFPHAHYLGKQMIGYALLPDGSQKWLIRIRQWDFNWQDQYQYKKPLFLPKGTILCTRWTYDNTADNPRNPSHPPRRVLEGFQSKDEMGQLIMQVVVRNKADLRKLEESHLHHSLRKRNRYSSHHFYLAGIHSRRGEIDPAVFHYERAVQINPHFVEAYNQLGLLYFKRGDVRLSKIAFESMLRVRPDDARALYRRGMLCARQNDLTQAAEYFNRALRLQPDLVSAHIQLAALLHKQGKVAETVWHLRQALRYQPHLPKVAERLAWLLATCSDPSLRDGKESVRLAQQVAEAVGLEDVKVLDTLAAAHAEAGDFDEAVSWQQKAIGLSPYEQKARREARLELYKKSQPYRDPANSPRK